MSGSQSWQDRAGQMDASSCKRAGGMNKGASLLPPVQDRTLKGHDTWVDLTRAFFPWCKHKRNWIITFQKLGEAGGGGGGGSAARKDNTLKVTLHSVLTHHELNTMDVPQWWRRDFWLLLPVSYPQVRSNSLTFTFRIKWSISFPKLQIW